MIISLPQRLRLILQITGMIDSHSLHKLTICPYFSTIQRQKQNYGLKWKVKHITNETKKKQQQKLPFSLTHLTILEQNWQPSPNTVCAWSSQMLGQCHLNKFDKTSANTCGRHSFLTRVTSGIPHTLRTPLGLTLSERTFLSHTWLSLIFCAVH